MMCEMICVVGSAVCKYGLSMLFWLFRVLLTYMKPLIWHLCLVDFSLVVRPLAEHIAQCQFVLICLLVLAHASWHPPPFIAIECRIPRYDTYRVTPPPKKLHSASHSITVSKALDSRRLWPMRLSSLSHLLSSPRKPTPSSSFVAERGLTMPLTRYHLHEDQPQLCVCERI